MFKPPHHHRTPAVSKLGQRLARLANDFDRLAEQQAEQEKARKRAKEALVDSLRKGVKEIHARIAEIEKAGRWHKEYFNLFSVIERTHCEHTHSNVLAWFLNPTEAHGLGDAFLRAFVKGVFDEDLGDTTDVVVKREYKNCDIVIWRRADWVLVIENKVDSTQSQDQLHKYAQYWRNKFQERYFAYLTRDGERPNCDDFVGVSYQAVRLALTNLHGNEESELFIRHFVDHIWFARDDE
jgi:hypothetical protein